MGRVKVGDRIGLVADKIVESVCGVRVDEAVAYPLAGADTASKMSALEMLLILRE